MRIQDVNKMDFDLSSYRQCKHTGAFGLALAAQTHVGRVRASNEDSFRALWGDKSPRGTDAFIVVADGMGGHAAGEVASRMTVDGVVALVTNSDWPDDLQIQEYLNLLAGFLQQVNQTVFELGQEPQCYGMGTTCTAAVFRGSHVYLAHIGDSRAYILRAGRLIQITQDHSWVEEQVALGNLNQEDARTHPSRNVITRAIGLEADCAPDVYSVSLIADDVVLLCSDGLTSMVEENQLSSLLANNSPAAACDALVSAANQAGGYDNITVAVVSVNNEGTSTHSRFPVKPSGVDSPRSLWQKIRGIALRFGHS